MESRTNDGFCSICQVEPRKYTCPRCGIQYCSLQCYKNQVHLNCSESFYQEWFYEGLKSTDISKESKRMMYDMLARVEQEYPVSDPLEHGNVASIEERLGDLDLNHMNDAKAQEIWNRLSTDERTLFENAIKMGKLFDDSGNSVFNLWKPWWCNHQSSHIVEIDTMEVCIAGKHPPILTKVSNIESLQPQGKELSPFIVFDLANVLYSYVLFQRLYNGCAATDFPLEFCDACMGSSDVLSKNATFTTAEESIISSVTCCSVYTKTLEFSVEEIIFIEAVKDVCHLLIGPNKSNCKIYVCAALSELYTTFKVSRRLLKSNTSACNSEKLSSLFKSMKKIEFYLAWSMKHFAQFTIMSIELHELYVKKVRELKCNLQIKESVEVARKNPTKETSKPLITEIN